MHTEHSIEERLWEYIDGISTSEERSVIDELVRSNTEWKEKYAELLEVNKLLSNTELEAPSMRFSKNVMEEISRLHIAPATSSYINKRIIWSIGLFFLTIIIGFLVYGFSQADWSTSENFGVTDKLGKVDFGKFFNNSWVNAFMMINIIVGLFFFDKYLSGKRKQYRKEA